MFRCTVAVAAASEAALREEAAARRNLSLAVA
jgi:hypothetical protein